MIETYIISIAILWTLSIFLTRNISMKIDSYERRNYRLGIEREKNKYKELEAAVKKEGFDIIRNHETFELLLICSASKGVQEWTQALKQAREAIAKAKGKQE